MKVKDTPSNIKDITDETIRAIEELNRRTEGRYHPVYRLIRIFPNVNNNEVAEEVTRLATTLAEDKEIRGLAQEPQIKGIIDNFLQAWGQTIISRNARQIQALTAALQNAGITLKQSLPPVAHPHRNHLLVSGGEEVGDAPLAPSTALLRQPTKRQI